MYIAILDASQCSWVDYFAICCRHGESGYKSAVVKCSPLALSNNNTTSHRIYVMTGDVNEHFNQYVQTQVRSTFGSDI